MRLLINTIADDLHADAVGAAMRSFGHKVRVLRHADFPERQTLSFSTLGRSRLSCRNGPQVIDDMDQFDVVWNRRSGSPTLPTVLAESDRAFARQEIRVAQQAFWAMTAPAAFWVNSELGAERANHKPLQLKLAAELQLAIPDTLISNDPARVRAFVGDRAGRCIYKPLGPGDWQENGAWHVTYTSRVEPADLPADALLQACPGIYQALIGKRAEVRATFMGEHCVALRIDSQATRHGHLDWRRAQNMEAMPCAPIELPEDLQNRCRALMRALGIVFGCFDFIIDERGEFVFLEVNEAGQFLFLESWCPDLPVLDMFCQFLASASPWFRYQPALRPLRFLDYVTEPA